MKRTSSSSEAGCQPSEHLNHRLNMYSIAAGAAGVGLLALAQPTTGEIVYTPAHVVLAGRSDSSSYELRFDHSGTVDFYLSAMWTRSVRESGGFSRIFVTPARQGNRIVGYHGSASALPEGEPIDSGDKFSGKLMAWMNTYFGSGFGSGGKWQNTVDSYLGLKFSLHGETHYGWARLTVSGYEPPLTATLTGYAYETEPNKRIIAGKTSGPDESSLVPKGVPRIRADRIPATLGALALGAPSLSVWRRRETAVDRSGI